MFGDCWNGDDPPRLFGKTRRAREIDRDSYSVALIHAAFAGFDGVQVWGDDFRPGHVVSSTGRLAAIATDSAYLSLSGTTLRPRAIVLGHDNTDLLQISHQWRMTAPELRAILLHPYLPGTQPIPFAEYELPFPLPLLPILLGSKAFVFRPDDPSPTANQFAIALKVALERDTHATFEEAL